MNRIVPYMQSAYTVMILEKPLCSGTLHGVATKVLNCLKHNGGLWAWPEPKHNRNGIMLNRRGTVRVSVVIRGELLVFVDNRGNFGTTDIYEKRCWKSF